MIATGVNHGSGCPLGPGPQGGQTGVHTEVVGVGDGLFIIAPTFEREVQVTVDDGHQTATGGTWFAVRVGTDTAAPRVMLRTPADDITAPVELIGTLLNDNPAECALSLTPVRVRRQPGHHLGLRCRDCESPGYPRRESAMENRRLDDFGYPLRQEAWIGWLNSNNAKQRISVTDINRT